MPNFSLSRQPRFPTVTVDTDDQITAGQIEQLLNGRQGITLCVRASAGNANRGGYFFCIAKEGETEYRLETVEGDFVAAFSLEALTRFINHASGRCFDVDMLEFCQNHVNFRED